MISQVCTFQQSSRHCRPSCSAELPRRVQRAPYRHIAAWGDTGLSLRQSSIQEQQQRRRRQHKMAAPAPAAVPGGAAEAQPAEPAQQTRRVVQIQAVDITEENFKPFGQLQLVGATDDGKEYDQEDAQLDLRQGQPRFYIMRLPRRGRTFERITYHANVTQCLGGLQPSRPWYLVVSRPTLAVEQYPQQQDLAAFRIPHGVFVKLHKGTWHAGPLFDGPSADFYNLELSDTNVVDHNTHDYGRAQGLAYEVVD